MEVEVAPCHTRWVYYNGSGFAWSPGPGRKETTRPAGVEPRGETLRVRPRYRRSSSMAAVQTVTDAEFDQKVLQAEGPVVVDFWAPWCGPCLRLAPILEEVAQELGDGVAVYKLNTDENPSSPGTFGVMSIPTLIVFRNGQEVDRIAGLLPKDALRQKLQAAFN